MIDLEAELEKLLCYKRKPTAIEEVDFAHKWLRSQGEPTDLLRVACAAHVVGTLWEMRKKGEI